MKYTLKNRMEQFKEAVTSTSVNDIEGGTLLLENGLIKSYEIFVKTQKEKNHCYIIGNGGSAAIASHAVIDFMNVGKINASTLHDSATLTCMANDYGYENAFSNIIKLTLNPKDILIAISSSGQSKNIINAVESAKNLGSTIITLSGFDSENPLRKLGDINYWCNSRDYGMVEICHQFILHNLADRFMETEI